MGVKNDSDALHVTSKFKTKRKRKQNLALIGLERQHVHRHEFVPETTRLQSGTRLLYNEALLRDFEFQFGVVNKIDSGPHSVRKRERSFGFVVSDPHPKRVLFQKQLDGVGENVDLEKRTAVGAVPQPNTARKRPEMRVFEGNRYDEIFRGKKYIRSESIRAGDGRTCRWGARNRSVSGSQSRREGGSYTLREEWTRFGGKVVRFVRFCQTKRKTGEGRGRAGFRADSRTTRYPGSIRRRGRSHEGHHEGARKAAFSLKVR